MKNRSLAFVLLAASTFGGGCSDMTNYYFDGQAYDGKTGAAITGYNIELQYLDRTEHGSVDKNGRYFLGPLTPFNDYTVTINATGYRPFSSANAMRSDLKASNGDGTTDDTHPDRSQDYDAYLYATSDATDPATLSIVDASGPVSGAITITPKSTASPFTSADVNAQVWNNDDDLRQAEISEEFMDGTLSLAAGLLTYGVTYEIVIDTADDIELSATYTAGIEGDKTFVLSSAAKATP